MNCVKQNTAIICLSANFGGMELDTIKLAKKLSPYMKIVLVTKTDGFTEKNFDNYFDKKDNVSLESIAFRKSLSLNIINRAKEIIQNYDIRNVIYFGASELKSLYFAFLGFKINLIVRHGTTKSTPKKDFFHKLVYSKVNYHVSICKHLQKNVRYIIPFGKNSKEVLIYPSIEYKNIQKIKNKKLILVHTGRISEGKGQVDAIKACEVLVKNDIDFDFFLLGGFEDGYEKKFMSFYNNIEYKNKIILIGFSNEVDKYLAMADIFLFPSYGEGFGNSFVEALFDKCKCISYANTSFIEFKELGFDFELVEDRNMDKLKETLLRVARGDIKFNLDKNQDLAKMYFSQDREIKEYLEILI